MLSIGPAGSQADAIAITGSASLIDETGQPVTLSSYKQYLRLVFFGYTQCPDICPLTMYFVANALKMLGPDAEKVRVLFITIDPKRDTPEILANYTAAFHPAIIGLTGSYDTLMDITEEFRTTFGYTITADGKERTVGRHEYAILAADAPYVPYHSSQIYLLDRAGRIADVIGYGSDGNDIAARLRKALAATNDAQEAGDVKQ